MALAMAEAFVADGVAVVACTPHILPGLYHNNGPDIRRAVDELQARITDAGVPLRLTTGADVHLAPGLLSGLRSGTILSVADSRYVLIEPPHHVLPARLEETLFELLVAGYVPVITHPERLSWITAHYALIQRLARQGVWMQVTAGSLTGRFGKTALHWANRMLDEGIVHILASDAHDVSRRRPDLSQGAAVAAARVGVDEAHELVIGRPQGIIDDVAPEALSQPRGLSTDHDRTAADGRDATSRRGISHGDEDNASGLSGAVRGIGQRLRRLVK